MDCFDSGSTDVNSQACTWFAYPFASPFLHSSFPGLSLTSLLALTLIYGRWPPTWKIRSRGRTSFSACTRTCWRYLSTRLNPSRRAATTATTTMHVEFVVLRYYRDSPDGGTSITPINQSDRAHLALGTLSSRGAERRMERRGKRLIYGIRLRRGNIYGATDP